MMAYKEEYPGLLFEKKGHIAYVTFNNPKVLNAISYFMKWTGTGMYGRSF